MLRDEISQHDHRGRDLIASMSPGRAISLLVAGLIVGTLAMLA